MSNAIKRFIGRVPDVSAVMARFPVPVALMGMFTIILILLIQQNWDEERFAYLLGGIVLAAYLMVSFTLSRETNSKSPLIILQIIGSALICVLAWFAEDIYFFLPAAIAASILILGNSVRHRRERDDLHVWDFTHKLWTGAVFAAFGSFIFVMGMLAIIFALKSLFGLDMENLVTDFILPIGLGFLAPLYWMSTLPAVNEPYAELHENPGFVSKAVAFLGTWLLTPLILIYALILLAYGVKIILEGTLPKGEIAQLTTPFLLIGTLNWLVLEPPFIQKHVLARLFRKVWFWLSVPVSILLGIAVYVRVAEYGLTVERVLLVFVVFWSLGLGLWFTLRPEHRRDIRFIPGFAALLAIAAACLAPITSVINQDKRLAHYLNKSGLVVEGVLTADNKILDMEAAKKARGSLSYLLRHDEYGRIEKRIEKLGGGISNLPTSLYVARLGLAEVEETSRFRRSVFYNTNRQPVSIVGYEWMAGPFSIYGSGDLFDLGGHSLGQNNGIVTLRDSKSKSLSSFNISEWSELLKIREDQFLVENPLLVLFDNSEKKVAIRITRLNRYGDGRISGDFYILTKGLESKPE